MEKEEIDLMICENQLEIDYSSLESNPEDEESSLLPEGFVVPKNNAWIDEEVLFVVIKVENEEVCKNLYKADLCGKEMIEWVKIAGNGCETRVINDPKDSLIPVLNGIETSKRYIAVFYSDTPLIEKSLFHKIMDYFCKNCMNAMALVRGFVFKTDFIKNIDRFVSTCANTFDEQAFTRIDSARTLNCVSKILYDRIRNFHVKNGVIMYGGATSFIDADVEIEKGSIIYPNNIIRGQTYIGKNVILESGNVISDSIISDDAVISSSYIEKSKISKGKIISPYEKIINSEV